MEDPSSHAAAEQAPSVAAYRQQVNEAAAFIQDQWTSAPRLGLILGTGLSPLAEQIDVEARLPYAEVPHMSHSTVASHDGRFLAGMLRGVPVLAMQGRFHLYEGYSAREVALPVRVMGTLDIEALLVANAAGGMNPQFAERDLMLITDHINLQGANPLVGPNVDDWGPRFPDMSEPYDPALRTWAEEVALDHQIKLQQGVYVAVAGPNLETKAEYRMLRRLGADAVGMSTVPEVIVARHMGIRVLALSVITDECFPDALAPVTMDNVLAAARAAEPQLTTVFTGVIERLGATKPVTS
jgi:purine-nucleoside phosphorylase